MPNRILKESICASETVEKLSWFEEVFFYRLIVNCDDYGRMDARPQILKARMFPLKNVTDKQVKDALNKLSTVGIVQVYEYDQKPYLQFVTWERHQQMRAKRSKYPAYDSTCNQLISDDCNSPRNPIQSETESETPYNPPKGECRFDVFWSAYPRKIGKGAAEKKFQQLKPDDGLLQTMLTAIEQQKKSEQWKKDGGQYIPNPATWIGQRRWEDELENKGSIFDDVI